MDNKQWHGGKGSSRRNSNEDAYADGWELAFGKKKPEIKTRKAQPKQSMSKIHRDRSKQIPRDYKYNNEEEI